MIPPGYLSISKRKGSPNKEELRRREDCRRINDRKDALSKLKLAGGMYVELESGTIANTTLDVFDSLIDSRYIISTVELGTANSSKISSSNC